MTVKEEIQKRGKETKRGERRRQDRTADVNQKEERKTKEKEEEEEEEQ